MLLKHAVIFPFVEKLKLIKLSHWEGFFTSYLIVYKYMLFMFFMQWLFVKYISLSKVNVITML